MTCELRVENGELRKGCRGRVRRRGGVVMAGWAPGGSLSAIRSIPRALKGQSCVISGRARPATTARGLRRRDSGHGGATGVAGSAWDRI